MRFLFLLLLLTACTTTGPWMARPPVLVERNGVRVRGSDVEEAERVSGEIAELDRRVRELLGATDPPTPEFWLLDEEIEGPATGASCFVPPVVGLERGQHENRQVIGHELAHHYVRRWPTLLPLVIEEGLADLVGGMARDELGEVRDRYAFALCRTRVTNVEEVLKISSQELGAFPDRRISTSIRSVGFALADRIGLDGLHQMCVRAAMRERDEVPPRWFVPYWAEISPRSYQGSGLPPGTEVVILY